MTSNDRLWTDDDVERGATVMVAHMTNGCCPLSGPCEMCDCFDPTHEYERKLTGHILGAVLPAIRTRWLNELADRCDDDWFGQVTADWLRRKAEEVQP